MATEKQIRANRDNAQASTGPQSQAGKQATSKNALRHGLTATSIDQFPPHLQEQYLDFRDTLLSEFQPGTQHELLLFDQYAFAQFLNVRAQALHANALDRSLAQPADPEAFNHLLRVQRYLTRLDRAARQAHALLEQSYANRCAAVEVQDIITHNHNSPVIVPASAPLERMLNHNTFRAGLENVAMRVTFVEQARLSRKSNEPNPPDRQSTL